MRTNTVVTLFIVVVLLAAASAFEARAEQVPSESLPGLEPLPGMGGGLPGMGEPAAESGVVNTTVDTRTPAARGPLVESSLLLDAARAGDRIVAVGERGIVLLSDDQGESWRQANVPARTLLTAIDFADDQLGWAVGHDAMVLNTTDGGENWVVQHYAPELDAPMLDVVALDARTVLVSAALGMVFRTEDGGASWTDTQLNMTLGDFLGMPESFDDFSPHWFAVDRAGDGSLYLAGERGVIAHSDDGGRNWQQISSPYNGSLFGVGFLSDGGVIVYGMRGNAFASSDGGVHWRKLETGTDRSLNADVTLANGSLLLSGMAGTMLWSGDSGATFIPIEQPNRADVLAALPVSGGADRGEVLLLTSRGKRMGRIPAPLGAD